MNLLIEYPKCSTCQKARKWLEEHQIPFQTRHIVNNVPSEEELQSWIKLSGLELKRFFNSSGLKYKELNLKEKLLSMSETDKIKLLASDGMLIKRPIFLSNDSILLGFKEAEWEKELLKEEKNERN